MGGWGWGGGRLGDRGGRGKERDERDGGGGRERRGEREEEEDKGHTINELCIIVLLLVLNYYVLSYFISFRETINGAKQMNYV